MDLCSASRRVTSDLYTAACCMHMHGKHLRISTCNGKCQVLNKFYFIFFNFFGGGLFGGFFIYFFFSQIDYYLKHRIWWDKHTLVWFFLGGRGVVCFVSSCGFLFCYSLNHFSKVDSRHAVHSRNAFIAKKKKKFK